ncbi:putative bis(5'-nucleosyl)-tetraphosphatase [Aspergillus candidus]|uniref:Bis-tetraphosphatase n=1 Tax=Aspergillus candidus TaxID=41067 RepID=A0A2I2F164_ASPCN|nr:bis-tetraphosphatase [Aspergillus candidus]PLB34382.1 bis-tetraphosphatase [Aspergillus candidus]
MQLGLSENLSSLVARRFVTARDAGHLIFSETHLTTVYAAGIPCQLRYCPALAKKPSGTPKPDQGRTGPKPDPFHDPSPELLVAQIPPSHLLVLNKFPVIPNHFILATKAWKSQTDILEKDDLEAAYACIKAWDPSDNNNNSPAGAAPAPRPRLFAFFNSGDESGASQPHRHLQFLPVEAMTQDSGDGDDWRPLIDAVAQSPPPTSGPPYRRLSQLPFAHFALPLSENPSADELHSTYLALYRAAVATLPQNHNHNHNQSQDPPTTGPAAISYNLAMTESTMLICPRKSESAQIAVDNGTSDEVAEAGVVALNGTILAGTLMVKAEAEWNELRRNPESLAGVLAAIGYPHPDLRFLSLL